MVISIDHSKSFIPGYHHLHTVLVAAAAHRNLLVPDFGYHNQDYVDLEHFDNLPDLLGLLDLLDTVALQGIARRKDHLGLHLAVLDGEGCTDISLCLLVLDILGHLHIDPVGCNC